MTGSTIGPAAAIEMAGGRAAYEWAARRRPFVHPMTTPAGDPLTVDAPDDHPWHHGLWFTVKFVNDENYWEEMAPYGVLRHRGRPEVSGGPGSGRVDGGLDWVRPDRETVVLREERTWSWHDLDPGAYALDLRTTLRPEVDVVLDRTPFTTWGGYGGLTLRGAPDWVDTRFLLGGSAGSEAAARDRVLGEPAPWCDCSGRFPSGRTGGALLLDHPQNRRHPVPWYGSTRNELYGDDGWSNFLCAAFLFHEPLTLAAGEPLEIRHRVVCHDDAWDTGRCAAEWDRWVRET
jgi:hypothetical protein